MQHIIAVVNSGEEGALRVAYIYFDILLSIVEGNVSHLAGVYLMQRYRHSVLALYHCVGISPTI